MWICSSYPPLTGSQFKRWLGASLPPNTQKTLVTYTLLMLNPYGYKHLTKSKTTNRTERLAITNTFMALNFNRRHWTSYFSRCQEHLPFQIRTLRAEKSCTEEEVLLNHFSAFEETDVKDTKQTAHLNSLRASTILLYAKLR